MKHSRKIVALAVVASVVLAGCESTNGLRLRTQIGAGLTELGAEHKPSGTELAVSGNTGTARVEVSRAPDYMPNIEVGLRVLGGVHNVSGANPGFDLDTTDLGGALVFRPFLDVSDDVRLYAEGFAGYRHSWGDLTIDGLGSDRGDYGGILFGGGLGAEFSLSRSTSLVLGVEWSRNILTEQGVRLDIDDFVGTVGFAVGF